MRTAPPTLAGITHAVDSFAHEAFIRGVDLGRKEAVWRALAIVNAHPCPDNHCGDHLAEAIGALVPTPAASDSAPAEATAGRATCECGGSYTCARHMFSAEAPASEPPDMPPCSACGLPRYPGLGPCTRVRDTDNGRGPIPDEEYERDPGAPWNRGPSATEAPALDLDELERLHARAEPGRWSFVYRHDERVGKKTVRVPSQVVSEGSIIGDIHVSQDGEAIAALHNAAPELIRRARERDELRAEVSRLLAAHDVEERRQEERAVRTKCHDRTRTLGRKSR